MKRQRVPRVVPPAETPLDSGSVEGTDRWREVGGIEFCHWDRWLLRLALDESEGLASIAAEFTKRARQKGRDEIAEAMLTQIADLERRLLQLNARPVFLLDDVERASRWLKSKAARRVLDARKIQRTLAMQLTPRRLLEGRALRGNWGAFAILPAPYYARFKACVGDGYYGFGGAQVVVLSLQIAATKALQRADSEAERLSIHRGMLTAVIESMDQVDDSGAELAEHFREQEEAFLALVQSRIHEPDVLTDLLELVVWEDYGLFSKAEEFLRALPCEVTLQAQAVLLRLASELDSPGLEYQLSKCERLRHRITRLS